MPPVVYYQVWMHGVKVEVAYHLIILYFVYRHPEKTEKLLCQMHHISWKVMKSMAAFFSIPGRNC